jgi:hypothetical protein
MRAKDALLVERNAANAARGQICRGLDPRPPSRGRNAA